jgi:hypothetical protein
MSKRAASQPQNPVKQERRHRLFISYARVDSAFADELVGGLDLLDTFEVLIDRKAIHEGEDWQARLGNLIVNADTVVFVLSPRSAASEICRWEVEEAERLSKRIIPVQATPLDGVAVPKQLAALNYVRFDPEEDGRPRSFTAGLAGLRRAVVTDIDWVREHTRLLTRAMEWEAAGRAADKLLLGGDVAAAKAWLARRSPDSPTPTELQFAFINASDLAETERQSAERQRAERLQRLVRGTQIALAVAILLGVAAGGAGWFAYLQQQAAEKEAKAAKIAQANAERRGSEIKRLILDLSSEIGKVWPLDALSPDYQHLAGFGAVQNLRGKEFVLTPKSIELLISSSGFEPVVLDGKLIVTLRGATFVDPPQVESEQLRLRDDRPDHTTFKSVVVVYNRAAGRLTGFVASTVPSLTLIKAALARGGQGANLMPTGCYEYVVRSTYTGSGPRPGNLGQDEEIVVRRTTGNPSYEIIDPVSLGSPRNNLHPSFRAAGFSSAGTTQIPGSQARDHPFAFSGPFEAFRGALGLSPGPDLTVDHGKKLGLVMFTGLDAAVAGMAVEQGSQMADEERVKLLERIRFGSKGNRVKKLQEALGVPIDSRMNPKTVEALARLQFDKLGWWDGIYSPRMDELLGFCVYRGKHCSSSTTPKAAAATK